ncbi:hypothetical protein [Burkholderia sp. MSMB1459WGS]|uniref:hypothetical protein n=1 Tax=Burkholderia sp. MSMB1459WGS TaxID=1637970 RepID=UPI00211D1752|nr:hypothetical protein [Burkholderia sp. MSMB1459WGS]
MTAGSTVRGAAFGVAFLTAGRDLPTCFFGRAPVAMANRSRGRNQRLDFFLGMCSFVPAAGRGRKMWPNPASGWKSNERVARFVLPVPPQSNGIAEPIVGNASRPT